MPESPHPEAEAKAEAEGSTQATPKDTKLVYEIGFHLVPALAEGEVAALVGSIRGAVEKAGGAVFAFEEPKRLKLAYRIIRPEGGKRGKYTEAWFGWLKFDGEDELRSAIPELKQWLEGQRDILRFLLVETVRETAAPARAVFTSDRLEGTTIEKPKRAEEKGGEVSEAELEKGIESLIG